MDDDPTLALTWDKLFKKANRNEYTSVSEMNEVFKHAGYRIETGGRIMGDGKVRLYKTDSDGNEAVVLEEELGENGLAPVRKYLSNNMTTEEANSITSAAMIVRDNLVKKADQFVQEKYKGVVDENGEKILCGWLVKTNGMTALLEWIISNPKFMGKKVYKSL